MFLPSSVRRATFRDRAEAGKALATSLGMFVTDPDVVVLGLPRGGVPVAREVADSFGVSMDVLVARKLGVPGIEAVALGAVAEGSDATITDSVAWYLGVPSRIVADLGAQERVEIERRVRLYRDARPFPDVRDRVVVLVDDGLATGATLRAAAQAIRARRPRRVIAAVPVASRSGMAEVARDVDAVVAVKASDRSQAVSASYDDYAPISDTMVMQLLGRPFVGPRSTVMRDVAEQLVGAPPYLFGEHASAERRVEIPVGLRAAIVGDLGMPRRARPSAVLTFDDAPCGLAILAHAGGGSRDGYRNRYLAGRLRLAGYATLRLDLLTPDEQERDARDASLRFDVSHLAARFVAACDWARNHSIGGASRTVLVAASTGAGAALHAAAELRGHVAAIVARGGRVHLAADVLPRVVAPVLMLVGELDRDTLYENADALRFLPRTARLVRIKGAGHAFEQPGAIGAVGEHAVAWLDRLR
jgi:putative phosphoribosyl transferase